MKKALLTASLLVGLAFSVSAFAQEATLAELDFVAADLVSKFNHQCELALPEANEWQHIDCVIDGVETECIETNAPNAEGREGEKCNQTTYRMWDAKLNEYYGRLMEVLDETAKNDLRNAQRTWLEFHEQDGSSLTSIWQLNDPQVAGTVALLSAQLYKTEALKDRTKQLYEMLSFLELSY